MSPPLSLCRRPRSHSRGRGVIAVSSRIGITLVVGRLGREDRRPVPLGDGRVVHAPVSRPRRGDEVHDLCLLAVLPPAVRLDAGHDEEGEVRDEQEHAEGRQGLHHLEVLVGGGLRGEAVVVAVEVRGAVVARVVFLALAVDGVVPQLVDEAQAQRGHDEDGQDPQHEVHAHVCARVNRAPAAAHGEGDVLSQLPDDGCDGLWYSLAFELPATGSTML